MQSVLCKGSVAVELCHRTVSLRSFVLLSKPLILLGTRIYFDLDESVLSCRYTATQLHSYSFQECGVSIFPPHVHAVFPYFPFMGVEEVLAATSPSSCPTLGSGCVLIPCLHSAY